mmetsp:Transcript_47851/g.116519  ORF Transcript_47851/g.116519 Transcript_47851/m.116519 type:complete len:162 (-) Transcript_47851:91-576(-)
MGGAPMAETLIKIAGLCVTYMAFQTATDACREPVARAVEKIERQGLLQFLVDFVAMLEEAGGRAIAECASSKPRNKAQQTWTHSPQQRSHRTKPTINVPVTDLCDMCLENFRTVEELRSVAIKMGLPYPGDEMEPCHFCRDRAMSLYKLETVYRHSMGGKE